MYHRLNGSKYISTKLKTNLRILIIGLFVAAILVAFVYSFGTIGSNNDPFVGSIADQNPDLKTINAAKECYKLRNSAENVQIFDDIEKTPPKPDNSIFFIDTTCYDESRITLNARKACALESAAKLNPNRDIYILFVAPVGFVANEPDSPVIAALKSYPNVYFRHVDIYNYSRNTPAEQWIKKDQIFLSHDYRFHLSDYLRLITLYKFGGIYFDLDFMIVKNLDSLPPNFAPQEKPEMEYINNSVLGFSTSKIGHKIAEMILRECFENYKPHTWDYNGPWAVWRATKIICQKTKMVDMMRPELCWGFSIMPYTAFFPLRWYTEAFDRKPTEVKKAVDKITNETFAVHLWSSNSNKVSILKSEGSNMYTIFAEKVCPRAYGASGPYFN